MAQSLCIASALVASQGICTIRAKAQASSSVNNCAPTVQSTKCSLNSPPRLWTNRIEKLSQTLYLTGGSQLVNFGLPELRRRTNVASSSKQATRGVVSAACPISLAQVTQSDLYYLSTISPVPGPGSVELAANLFTLATAIVVPFYTVMILAPKWEWTDKLMCSEIPYFILGSGYIYLLALAWTPETLGLMFSSKYWLPELPGITRMFSSTLTVASAWLHLLAADLFAGRQVFLDGAKHNVETRHSLVLCLMMCPIGILSHLITKNLTLFMRRRNEDKNVKRIPPY